MDERDAELDRMAVHADVRTLLRFADEAAAECDRDLAVKLIAEIYQVLERQHRSGQAALPASHPIAAN